MMLTDPSFPWSALGVVHLSNSVRLRRPLAAGQGLRIEVECGPLVPHQKGQAFTLHTRIYRRGEAVWDGDSVYLKRGVRSESTAPCSIRSKAHVPLLAREARWQLPPQLGRDYAKASGDFNPIHLHVLTAKAFGFPRAIAHGMWTLARTLAALHPVKTLASGHAHGDFKSPLFLPGDATLWSAAPSPVARFRSARSRGRPAASARPFRMGAAMSERGVRGDYDCTDCPDHETARPAHDQLAAAVRRVAIIGSNRIPFARSNTAYASASNQDMLSFTLQGLVDRFDLHGMRLGEVAAGAVVKHSRDFNLTREARSRTTLAKETPAYDVQQACGTGLETAILVANKIALGQIDAGIAGGVDTASDAPIGVNERMRKILLEANRGSRAGQRVGALAKLRPGMFFRPLCRATPSRAPAFRWASTAS